MSCNLTLNLKGYKNDLHITKSTSCGSARMNKKHHQDKITQESTTIFPVNQECTL